MQRRQEERAEPAPQHTRAAVPTAERATSAEHVLGLQGSAGNAAVAAMLQRQPRGSVAQAHRTYTRAASAYEAGEYRRALRLFERLTESPATTAEAMPEIVWNLAVTRARLGDIDGAMTEAMTYGQYRRDDQSRLLELIERIQNEQANAIYVRASSAYERGRYRQALVFFERLVEAPATTTDILPEIIWNIAATRARLGDIDGAMTDAMTYGQYRPDELPQLLALIERIGGERATAQAHRLYERAASAYGRGRYGTALRLFERLTSSPATTAEAMPEIVWNIAVTNARLGRFDDAYTAAMTYGEYRQDDQERLLQLIQDIRGGRHRAHAAGP
jgi:tetratricopeptide (TPR) repeat protein